MGGTQGRACASPARWRGRVVMGHGRLVAALRGANRGRGAHRLHTLEASCVGKGAHRLQAPSNARWSCWLGHRAACRAAASGCPTDQPSPHRLAKARLAACLQA
jgi:hypothetical protein